MAFLSHTSLESLFFFHQWKAREKEKVLAVMFFAIVNKNLGALLLLYLIKDKQEHKPVTIWNEKNPAGSKGEHDILLRVLR